MQGVVLGVLQLAIHGHGVPKKELVKTIHGDLIQLAQAGRFDVIVHGCNCFCTMGKGVAKSIKAAFPEAYAADCRTKPGDRDKLGSFSKALVPLGDHAVTVVNAYTQYEFGGPGPNVSYDAVREAFRAVKQAFHGARIGYPRIGAGLARGDWGIIATIIEDELRGEDHTLVVHEQPRASQVETAPVHGINIFSGAGGLGSALTNPTGLAREKGKLRQAYPVRFRGKDWPDAEAAYQHLKQGEAASDDLLMAEIIAAKLRQHPRIMQAIEARGGEAFLRKCSHLTGARTASAQAWEGKGLESRFIRNLVTGYAMARSDPSGIASGEQGTLF
jgi:O-acetyl-ADP-ribose deacetylase (regulator of RNase III)